MSPWRQEGDLDRLTQRDLRALLDCLREGYAIRDLDAFPAHVLAMLTQLVPADHISYNEVNPNSRRVKAVAEPANAVHFPDAMRIFEHHVAEHPLIAYYARTHDSRALKLSDFLSWSQLHRLGLYQEFFRRVGVEHQMAATLPAPPPLVIGVALNRGRRDFTERERLLLNLLRPHLAQAYQNAEAVTQMQRELTLLRQGVEALDRGIIVLTQEGHMRLVTTQARQWLAEYFEGSSQPAGRLPEALQQWVKHERAVLARDDDVPPPRKPFVVEREGKRLVVRLLSDRDQSILIFKQEQTALAMASFEQLGLTRREADVLAWVAQGKTNAEIGTILSMSPRTVQKHLEHIYLKLCVENRTTAVVWAQELLRLSSR